MRSVELGDESDVGIVGDVWKVVGDDFSPLGAMQFDRLGGGSSALGFGDFLPF